MSRARSLAAATFAVVLAACSGGDGETGDLFSLDTDAEPSTGTTMPVEPTTTASTVADVARPDVEPVSCGGLLDLDDTDVALGLLDLPMNQRGVFEFARGETCAWTWAEDDARVVTIEPGLPSDTEPGAVLVGGEGTPVDGVGDAAAWFVDGDRGLLAVGAATTLGRLSFRITLDRPDVTPDERRDVAVQLAGIVLPRFPGVEPAPPPEVDLAAQRPPLDRSEDDLVAWWRAGVEEGRWEPGEGLVTLLESFVGLGPAPDGIDELDGIARSATGLVAAGRDVVANGDDGEVVDRLERLLADVAPSRERLERAVQAAPDEPDTGPSTTAPSTSAPNAFRRAATDPCPDPMAGGTCLVELNVPDLDEAYGEDDYVVYVAATNDSASFIGWSDDQVGVMIDAIRTSANWLEPRGSMPVVSVYLAPDGDGPTLADPGPDLCTVVVTPEVRSSPGQQQQFVAGQLAHCFLAATYTDLYTGRYPPEAWWSAGAAIWISNEIYPDANLEWIHLPGKLTGHELQTSLVERGQTNGMWFQHLKWQYTLQGVLDVLAETPGDPGADELAAWPEMRTVFHDYVQSLSDLGVPDSGQDQLAGFYDVPADLIEVDAPVSSHAQLDALRMNRLELQVLGGDTACIDAAASGGATLSWRQGARRETGNWSEDLPDTVEGTVLFAGSSLVDGGAMRVTVTDVVDDPDDCEPDDSDGDVDVDELGCDQDCGSSEYYTEPEE